MIPALPVPVPEGVPDWLANGLFLLGGLAIFGLVLWQVVRAFRNNRDDR